MFSISFLINNFNTNIKIHDSSPISVLIRSAFRNKGEN